MHSYRGLEDHELLNPSAYRLVEKLMSLQVNDCIVVRRQRHDHCRPQPSPKPTSAIGPTFNAYSPHIYLIQYETGGDGPP